MRCLQFLRSSLPYILQSKSSTPFLSAAKTNISIRLSSNIGILQQMDAVGGLSKIRDARVLSIQSHVVHGYAGNKCSVFPLQLHGFEVDFVNSVQFSNHAGNVEYLTLPTRYAHVKGQRLDDTQLQELYEGLKLNNVNKYTHILTGYCGNVNFLSKIGDIVKDLKSKDPSVLYVCDPVMGDNGRYYTPPELLPVYRDVIVPLADVLCPNAFELGELTGIKIESEDDCIKAVDKLLDSGVKVVVVTSGVNGTDGTTLRSYAVWRKEDGSAVRYRFTFPRLPGQFVGTGDVFAALLVVWLKEFDGDAAKAVERVLCSMQKLIRRTRDHAQKLVDSNTQAMCELRLVESRLDLLIPGTEENVVVETL